MKVPSQTELKLRRNTEIWPRLGMEQGAQAAVPEELSLKLKTHHWATNQQRSGKKEKHIPERKEQVANLCQRVGLQTAEPPGVSPVGGGEARAGTGWGGRGAGAPHRGPAGCGEPSMYATEQWGGPEGESRLCLPKGLWEPVSDASGGTCWQL